MKLIKHILTVMRTGFWRNLAKIGIGDPLNSLVYVEKYKAHRSAK